MKKTLKFKTKATSILRWLFYLFFRILITPYVLLVQNVRFKKNGFKIPKEPCLFLSNHESNWDGVYLEIMFPKRVIHFLVNEVVLRNAFLKFFMGNIMGMVRRGEGKNDMTSVKNILELKKKGKDIGIYPEGDIDIWGRTLPIDDSISKLAKKLNMPIVLLRIDGAYLRTPRWALMPRRSRITYNVTNVLTVEQIKSLTVNELHQTILNGISYDEMKYQEKANISVGSLFTRAQKLEYGLYWCPKCHALHTIRSQNNSVYCLNCDFVATLDKKYNFRSDYPLTPSNPTKWADMQREFIPDYIQNIPEGKPVLMSQKIRMHLAPRRHFFNKRYTSGTLKLYRDRIEHVDKDKYKTIIYLKDADKISLQLKGVCEIQTELLKIRFSRPSPIWSGYSWSEFANYLKENSDNKYK